MTGKDRAVVDRLLGIRERPAVDRPDDKDRR